MTVANTTRAKIIPSYPYVQYNDDPNIVAFFGAYNIMAQAYLDAFNNLNLPVYTQGNIVNQLLEWVATGLYGNPKPTLYVGNTKTSGEYNTDDYNVDGYNQVISVTTDTVYSTNDDVYKRILTWNLYKGDGKQFNIVWLKKRCMRWLIGPNGVAPTVDQTYPVSVQFNTSEHPGVDVVTITIHLSTTRLVSEYGDFDSPQYDTSVYNNTQTRYVAQEYSFLPIVAEQLKEAIESGAVNLPFGYTFYVDVVA